MIITVFRSRLKPGVRDEYVAFNAGVAAKRAPAAARA
jgi:hypothetical protein